MEECVQAVHPNQQLCAVTISIDVVGEVGGEGCLEQTVYGSILLTNPGPITKRVSSGLPRWVFG